MKNVIERMEEINAEERISAFRQAQRLPYEAKVSRAISRAYEFRRECWKRDLNFHVSVGGLDSIVLYVFLHKNGVKAPGISVSSLENTSNQAVHKSLGIEPLKPAMRKDGTRWSKIKVIQELGFPVISKEKASKIALLQNPSEKNKTVRHAIITGETGEYGGNRKGTRMKLPQKWLELFGGYENENEGVNYGKPPEYIKSSSDCCYYLKEKPCDDWAKEHNSVPFLGLMASEGGRREKSLMINGCNYFGKSTIRSAPFAVFMRQDLLRLALEMDDYYKTTMRYEIAEERGVDVSELVPSIIPTVYGEIAMNSKGELYTTGEQRTGCEFCGFGIHIEPRPHRFDRLHESNPKAWRYWLYECCTKPNGEKYGWGEVLTYIGVPWEFDSDGRMIDLDGQISLF